MLEDLGKMLLQRLADRMRAMGAAGPSIRRHNRIHDVGATPVVVVGCEIHDPSLRQKIIGAGALKRERDRTGAGRMPNMPAAWIGKE